MECPAVKIGDKFTYVPYTDNYPYEVVDIRTFKKRQPIITIRLMNWEKVEGYDYYSYQEYIYSSDETNPTKSISWDPKTYRFYEIGNKRGGSFHHGYARRYVDPHF